MADLLSKYVVPGCRVDLQAIDRSKEYYLGNDNSSSEGRKGYQSQVIDVLSDDRVEIYMPMEKSKLILLPVDAEFDLYFYTDGGLYQCYARVVDRYKNNSLYVLVLDLISNLRKHQRREYYRFSCALEMNSRQLQEEEEAALTGEHQGEDVLTPQLPLKSSVIVDISGGGLRFVANYAYEPQSMILCKYSLIVHGESKEYNLVGKVLSVRALENRKDAYEHRVQYVNVDAAKREEIIKYIFDEERKTLKNQKVD
ncbi:MAG: flagellar brake protein [Lachnospiraceae bacterium]|nr:flagellar brake protein [Lachnospiraceae bacterium]